MGPGARRKPDHVHGPRGKRGHPDRAHLRAAVRDSVRRPVDITILATDRQLQVIGDPIADWVRLEVALRYNEPSAASISLPLSEVSEGQIEPGCRLVVIRSGRVLISGPIERRGPQRWSATGQDAGAGTIDVTIADDLASIVAE